MPLVRVNLLAPKRHSGPSTVPTTESGPTREIALPPPARVIEVIDLTEPVAVSQEESPVPKPRSKRLRASPVAPVEEMSLIDLSEDLFKMASILIQRVGDANDEFRRKRAQ